jgi:ferredoxin
VILLSMLVKSAWCRYLCPYGALQGMLGVLSPVQLVKDDRTCTGCARCNRACPNGVDVAHARGTVTSAECMGCTSCISACPQCGTLRMRIFRRTTLDPAAFGLLFVAAFLLVVAIALFTGHWGAGLSPAAYRQVLQISSDVHVSL